MAYDGTKPFDTGYLADAPEELRENFRALKDDQIVDAGKLSGLSAGNATGKIPINNGEVNQNLNADLLDGKHAADFAASVHVHASATTSSDGFLSAVDKVKLNGIDDGAEVNQNAFAGVAVGDVTISADSKSDTLNIEAGAGIELTADPENDTLTVTLGSHTHDYLPLSGGTMTGTIIFNKAGQVMKSPGDNGVLRFDGGSDYNKGAFLSLHGMDYNSENAGAFQLSCRSSTFSRDLIGRPDGTLKWGGSNVVTEASGNAVTATTAAKLGGGGNTGKPMTFNWSGQSGQPTWLWGGNDGTNMYVYNPHNFVVAYADGSNYTAAVPNIYFNSGHNNLSWQLPSGGTWRCFLIYNQAQSATIKELPGGSMWSESPGSLPWFAFIVRVS